MGELQNFERARPVEPAEIHDFDLSSRRARTRWFDSLWVPVIAFLVMALAGSAALRTDWEGLRRAAIRGGNAVIAAVTPARFHECTHRLQGTCVVDGDTFRFKGEIIRIADIDTPEVLDFRCEGEKAVGERATARLTALLNAGPFELYAIDRATDVDGRSLRLVMRDGRSLGSVLVAEGLARPWDGARDPRC